MTAPSHVAETPEALAPAVSVAGVTAGYDRRILALQDVTFDVPRGVLAGLVGPNGSGKSTLLRVILGLLKPWRGEVRVFGEPAGRLRGRMGYMPQVELVDWDFPVSVRDLVMMGRYSHTGPVRWPREEDRRVVDQALDHMGLASVAHRQISELSGGQQRRMLFARTLAQEPDVFFLDEPLAGLDAPSQHDILSHFEELRNRGKTLLVATHDLSCVAACFDLTLLLNRRVVAYGPPAQVFTRELLDAAFGRHLLAIPTLEGLYVSHHDHG